VFAQDFGSVSGTVSTADFELDVGSIVINEINYNSADDFDPGDWVEFYNSTEDTVSFFGWSFMDSDSTHVFRFPDVFTLEPGEYFVLCRDASAFHNLFLEALNYMGNIDFGLSGSGELLRLFDQFGVLVDSVEYDDEEPWPVEPDGNGPTIELHNYTLDNALAENWSPSNEHGTPGRINDSFKEETNDTTYSYELFPAYPNPFNSTTTLAFTISISENIRLAVYDIYGREVTLILNQQMNAGHHTVAFDGSDLTNGLYFVMMMSKGNTQIRKMVLLK